MSAPISLPLSGPSWASTRMMMRRESTESTTPARRQTTAAPESLTVMCSMPVPDERGLGAQQRHRLALHVGAHQRAVGVVVLEERDERGGHRHELLRRDVDVVDLLALGEDEVPGLAGRDAVVDDRAVLVQLDVGLGDRVLVLFPGREVEAVRLDLGRPSSCALGPRLLLASRSRCARRCRRPCSRSRRRRGPGSSRGPAPFFTFRYGLSMKPNSLMRAKHERLRDQADVRAFRRLDRADAAVVGRVDVAHLEAGALAGRGRPAQGPRAAACG